MRFWIVVSLAALLCPCSTLAQSPLGVGTVSGQIIEAGSHDGLPDATVTLTNDALGFRRVMRTSDDGFFSAPAVPPAAGYVITVTRKDFADFVTTPFIVFVGRTLMFSINQERLPADQKKPTPVPVDAGSLLPQVETTKTGVALTVRNEDIQDLPSNSRLLDTFALLAPATSRNNANAQLSFAGIENSNAAFMDGVLTTSTYFGMGPGVGFNLSQDALYELQVYPVGATAEYGHAFGGFLNSATHVGFNRFHGTAYGFERIPSLGTSSRFALGQNLLRRQTQEGASLGGPVWPHKVFFFANVEDHSGNFDGYNRILNPLIANSAGNAVNPANCKATAAECAAAIKIIQPQMNVFETFSDHWENGLARVDYRRSERNQFGVEGNAMNFRGPLAAEVNSVAPNGGLLGIGSDTENFRMGKVFWTAAPLLNMTNRAYGSYITDRYSQPASTPGETGSLAVVVAGTTIGDSQPDPFHLKERRWDLVDNVHITAANHMIEAGIDYLRREYDVTQLPYANGLYVYPTLTAFAADLGGINQRNYSSFMQSFGDPNSAPWIRERNVYAQDTWRPTQRFTIVGGVRWDHFTVSQPTASTSFFNSGAITAPSVDWAPRVGVAFQSDTHTVIRVGYTWFYAPMPGNLLNAMYQGDAVLQQTYSLFPLLSSALVFPRVFTPTSVTNTGALDLFTAEGKLRSPRTQQITGALEERLSNDLSLTVSFIDSRGYKLYTATDTNFTTPTVNETYVINNSAGTDVGSYTTQIFNTRTDNTHAHVYTVENGGSSYYDAGSLQLQKRMGRGLSAQLAYTYAHAQINSDGPLVFNAAPTSYAPTDFGSDKGQNPGVPRNRGTISFVWRPMLGQNYNTALRAAVNGWVVTGILTVASTEYTTPLAIVSGQQFSASGATLLYPDTLNGSGGWGRVPFVSTGSLATGSLHTFDARVSREFTYKNRFKVAALIEGFNLFNNQYTTQVNNIAFVATAGVLNPVAGYGQAIAAQGFPQGTNARSMQAGVRFVF